MKIYFHLLLCFFACPLQVQALSEDISTYNVVWDSPSLNAAGTMPLGNGDIGANVYAIEDGDLYLLLSKNDAFTYQGDIFKTGRVKISLSPNPFKKGAKFKQSLDLKTGSVLIQAEDVTIRIWADANAPVYNVDIDSQNEISVTAQSDPWERFEHCCYNIFQESNPKPAVQDVHKAVDQQLIWYYHVGDQSVYDDDLKLYEIEPMQYQIKDPYRFNTFGNLLESKQLTRQNDKLSGKGKNFEILIHALTQQEEKPENWVTAIKEQARAYRRDANTWTGHCEWWQQFWQRSWIMASNTESPADKREKLYGEANKQGRRIEEDNAALISQNYNVFRFIMACQSRGQVQAKFNGGIFTQQLLLDSNNKNKRSGALEETKFGMLTHEDDRLWGRRFTWQNQRLLYWGMLAAGDFDLMNPFFEYYDKLLPLRKAITKAWFGHEGAYFRENICPTGSERDCGSTLCTGKPPKLPTGTTSPYYHEFYFYSGIELVTMMLEYTNYTKDPYFEKKVLLPMAREVIAFFDRHYERDSDGKLLIDPAQVLETFWRAKNPAPEIAGLKICLEGMLAKNLGDIADRKNWTRLLEELPAVPTKTQADGKIVIAPAEEYDILHNSENGELYPVFPSQLYGVAHGNQDIVNNTMAVRTNKDKFGSKCWTQDQIFWAYAGQADEAAKGLEHRFRAASTMCRFPLFGTENPDSCPDFDHFGSGSVAYQRMLLQENGDKIFLFPAWPAKWDVSFKLHTHNKTIVEGEVKDGKIIKWTVSPSHRAKDVTVCELQ